MEDERNLHGDSIKHFLPDSKRLGSILNVYVLHLLLQKKNLYIYINKFKKKKKDKDMPHNIEPNKIIYLMIQLHSPGEVWEEETRLLAARGTSPVFSPPDC